MAADELVFDAWAGLSHKRGLAGQVRGWQAPTWIGEHRRRLTAYRILNAYLDNCARHFSGTMDTTPAEKSERREYGDAALLVDVARQKLLGENPQLMVEQADTILAPAPGPDDPPEDDEDAALRADVERAQDRQEWLRQWATDERLRLKMTEVERDSIGLGDGIYVLGWSNTKKRARLRIFDPGFYFPVLDDGDEDDFPRTVHIAWELPPDNPQDNRTRIRRITYRLVPRDADARLAYATPDDGPATMTCLLSDAIFTLRSDDSDVDALAAGRGEYLLNEDGLPIRDVDLGIDFIPVVHVPNTVALKEHYGRSLLLSVAQVLDDIHATDTDISAAASTTGSPPITVSGAIVPQGDGKGPASVATYGPGTMYRLAEGGSMDVLDTSGGLRALGELREQLLERLSTNARVPGEVLGRVKASDVASGFLMALSFGPLQGLVEDMRLIRDEKYRLLLKFVQRMAIMGGTLPAGPALDAYVAFGSYMPSDLPGVVQAATQLLQARAISRQTAVVMLMEAGVPIEDAEAEVERIVAEDLEGALAFLEATGDEAATRQRLGLEGEGPRPATPEVPPGTVQLPGQPAQVPPPGQPAPAPAGA